MVKNVSGEVSPSISWKWECHAERGCSLHGTAHFMHCWLRGLGTVPLACLAFLGHGMLAGEFQRSWLWSEKGGINILYVLTLHSYCKLAKEVTRKQFHNRCRGKLIVQPAIWRPLWSWPQSNKERRRGTFWQSRPYPQAFPRHCAVISCCPRAYGHGQLLSTRAPRFSRVKHN